MQHKFLTLNNINSIHQTKSGCNIYIKTQSFNLRRITWNVKIVVSKKIQQ